MGENREEYPVFEYEGFLKRFCFEDFEASFRFLGTFCLPHILVVNILNTRICPPVRCLGRIVASYQDLIACIGDEKFPIRAVLHNDLVPHPIYVCHGYPAEKMITYASMDRTLTVV